MIPKMPVPDLIRHGHRFSDKIMLHLKQTTLCGRPFQNARFAPPASRPSTLRLTPRSDIETRPRRSLRRSPATWRSGYAAVCKTVYAGSIPAVASTLFIKKLAEIFATLLRLRIGHQGLTGDSCVLRPSAHPDRRPPRLGSAFRHGAQQLNDGDAVITPRHPASGQPRAAEGPLGCRACHQF